MGKITPKQRKIMQKLHQYNKWNGRSPSMRELAKLSGISDVKSVSRIIDTLIHYDILKKEKNKPRSIKITEKGEKNIDLSPLPTKWMPESPNPQYPPKEFIKNEITIPSFSSEGIEYQNKDIRTDGSDLENDLKTMIESFNLIMDRYFDGTFPQNIDSKRTERAGVGKFLNHLTKNKALIRYFGWGIMILIFTKGYTFVTSDISSALFYSIITVFVIKILTKL